MRIHEGMLVVVLAGSIAADACTLFTGPKSHPVTLSVTSDTIVGGVAVGEPTSWFGFTVPVAIHNGKSVPVSIDYCLVSVDQPSGAGWSMVWAPICALEGSTSPTVAPGETKTFQWSVSGATSGNGAPKWLGKTSNGTYRVSLVIASNETLESNPFVISVLTTSAVAAIVSTTRTSHRPN